MTFPLGDNGRPGGGGIDLPLGDNVRSDGAPSGGVGRRPSAGAATCSGGRPPAVGRPLEITRDASECSAAAGGADGDSEACSTGAVGTDSTGALGGADDSTGGAVSTGAAGSGTDSAAGEAASTALTAAGSTRVSVTGSGTTVSTGEVSATGDTVGGVSVAASTTAGAGATSAAASAATGWSTTSATGSTSGFAATAFFVVFGFSSGASAAGCFAAAAALAGAFLAGFASSGWSARVNPSRSARRVTMSAYASASEDDGPLAATPSRLQRSRTSAFVIPSSFASSWILIFFAATLSIQPFTVVFASRMLESMRIRVFVTVDPSADTFSDRLLVHDADLTLPRSGERST